MTAIANLATAFNDFQGGADSIAGFGAIAQLTFGGTWERGQEFSLILTSGLSGLQTQIGAGNVTEFVPSFLFTLDNKIYAMGGSTVYFCAIGQPLVWNDPNGSGNGFVTMTNWYGTPEPIVAMQAYQGYAAFFARRTIQIWAIDANPNNWNLQQILTNIGTVASLSVQQLGNLDVIFLSDTGYRSLRALDITLAAFINDLGSPIDALVQNSLLNGTAISNAAAVSVVEPLSSRYWSYLNGIIYVLSYYPSNKILAWSTYTPTDSNGNMMNITSFQVYQGQVWAYGTDSNGNPAAWQYGGANNNTYDTTKAKIQTGFLDAKTPGTVKQGDAADFVINAPQGSLTLTNPDSWTIAISADPQSAGDPTQDITAANFQTIYKNNISSFDMGANPVSVQGTHLSLYAQSNGDGNAGAGGPATLSEINLHFRALNENN
jgi:hypothetical protein